MDDNFDRLDQDFQTWFVALPESQRPQGLLTFMARLAKLTSPVMLPQDILSDLQEAAEELSDMAEDALELKGKWGAYDPMMSSVGEEFMTGVNSAGWYTVFKDKPVKVEVTLVTDPDLKHDVLMHLDDGYALQHADPDDLEAELPDPEAIAASISDERIEERLRDTLRRGGFKSES